MKQNQSKILYFPSIEVQSTTWLKSSLVIWDSIQRIVPKNYTPQDSDEIKEAIDLGLIESVYVTDPDREQTAEKFKNFISDLPYVPSGLELPGEADDFEDIHKDKVDQRLYPVLESLAGKFHQDDWFRIPKSLARGYMFFLANFIARKNNVEMGTDSADGWTVNGFYTENGNLSDLVYDRDASGFYSSLTIQELIPLSIKDVSLKKISHFSRTRKDERERFKLSLDKLSRDLSNAESFEDLQSKINLSTREVEAAKNDLRKAMSFAGEEVQSSLFSYGLPVSTGVYMAYGGDAFDLTKISTSILLGAVAAYGDYQRAARNRAQNPMASYLINVDKELIKKKSVPNHSFIMDQFIND